MDICCTQLDIPSNRTFYCSSTGSLSSIDGIAEPSAGSLQADGRSSSRSLLRFCKRDSEEDLLCPGLYSSTRCLVGLLGPYLPRQSSINLYDFPKFFPVRELKSIHKVQ